MNLGDWLRHMVSVCLMCVSTWLFVVSYFLRFPLFEGRFGRFMKQLVLYPVLLWLSFLILVAVQARPPDDDRYIRNCRNGRSPKETQWCFHDDKV
jgi:hypothetical protein